MVNVFLIAVDNQTPHYYFNFILWQNRRKKQSDFLFDNALAAQVSKRRWSWSRGEVLPGLLQQHLLCLWRFHRHQDCQRRQGDTTFKSSFHLTSSFCRPPSIFSSMMSLWRDFWERSSTWPSLTATIIRFGQNWPLGQFPENLLDHSHADVLNQNMLNIQENTIFRHWILSNCWGQRPSSLHTPFSRTMSMDC